jgi:tRNA nucleotidyltransferase (CCA-adding enzyme)
MTVFHTPHYVLDVLTTLNEAGYAAYLVGGCVRDILIGRNIHDWDITTSAGSGDVAALFSKTVETGAKFGTITVLSDSGSVEVTTFRSEGAYSDGRRPEHVEFITDLSEDLRRRDFTMNALAMTKTGEIIDLFGGREDIGRRLIRCVGNAETRFSEDALRMFRALRLSAQLGFDVEDETMEAIKKCAPMTTQLSAERVRDETEKMLLSGKPELAGMAVRLGLFKGRLRDIGSGFPGSGTGASGWGVGEFQRIGLLPVKPALRWAAFCAILLRGALVDSAEAFLQYMRLDAKTLRCAGRGAHEAVKGPMPDRTGIKRLLAESGMETVLCRSAADEALRGGNAVSHVSEVLSSGECCFIKDLAVTGDDLIALGYVRGRELGESLSMLLEHVIERPEDNKKEVLLKLAESFK